MYRGAILLGIATIMLPLGFYIEIESSEAVLGFLMVVLGALCLMGSIVMTQWEWKQMKKEEEQKYNDRLELEKKVATIVTNAIITELQGIREDLKQNKDGKK